MNNSLYEKDKCTNSDHVATPRWVVENIYSLINVKTFENIWLPFNNYDSEFKTKADELNLKYEATHIFDDLMISNPPFSQQNDIIERSFELIEQEAIKSFALLLPLATLETEKRATIFQAYSDKLSILIFKKRIKFIGHTTSFNRGCCWICYNIDALQEKRIQWV
ncbi:sugar-phosphate nucleotidyltransferase [Listeria monocytogenes]|nr:sugar-phosphate nucleotidyltransferase [Listeria monocytogenes]